MSDTVHPGGGSTLGVGSGIHRRIRHGQTRSLVRPAKSMSRMNRSRRRLGVVTDGASSPPLFWTLAAVIGSLCLLGLVFVLSASSVRANHRLGSGWYWFQRQSSFLGIGAVALIVGLKFNYHRWTRHSRSLMLLTIAALAVVLIPSPLSHEVNGSRRWIGPEFAQFQPSELAKLVMILWLARLLATRRRDIRIPSRTVVPAILMLGILCAEVVLEPDLGTTVLLVAITFLMLHAAGARLDSLLIVSIPVGAFAIVMAFQGYRWARMMAFLDPWKSESTSGWQVIQSRVGIASGGVWGVGLGNGRSKWGFLPEAHTDFIFSVIGEELGLIGCLFVLGAFVLLVTAGLRAAQRARDTEGRLIAVGISCWLGLQAFINIGVAVGVLPNKGLTLPFVSYGGSSLTITMFAAGILLNVARNPAVRVVKPGVRKSVG